MHNIVFVVCKIIMKIIQKVLAKSIMTCYTLHITDNGLSDIAVLNAE